MSEIPPAEQQRPDRGKQREARSALQRYLAKLRRVCGTIQTVEEWGELTTELNNLLGSFRLEIPPPNLGRLQSASQLLDASKAGIDSACQTLQLEVERAIDALPKGGCSCGCLGGGILAALIAAAALVGLAFAGLLLLLQPVEINMVNRGCDTLPVLQAVPGAFQPAVDLLGARLPDGIPTDGEGLIVLRALPVTIEVDGTSGQFIVVSVLGARQSYGISGNLSDVQINGVSVLDQAVDLAVRSRDRHEVVIVCN